MQNSESMNIYELSYIKNSDVGLESEGMLGVIKPSSTVIVSIQILRSLLMHESSKVLRLEFTCDQEVRSLSADSSHKTILDILLFVC